ncbi:MAG: TolC family protein, partial [Myxococcota bacterium]
YQDLTLQIRNLERNIRLEVRNQLQQLEARKAIVAEANARFEVARRNNDEVRERLKAGLVTGLEAADSAAELFQAEASLAQANFDQRITELALRRALASDPLDAVAAGAPNAQGAN